MTDFETVDFFTDESLVPDPYPYFDHLRSKCPVAHATPFNVLAITGYDEALAVYKNPAFSSCVSVAGPFSGMPFGPGDTDDVTDLIEQHRDSVPMAEHITSQDPPLHTRTRGLLNRLITPKRLKENEDFMWRLADEQLDTFIDKGSCEFLTDYAKPFSLLVIADLLGVPLEDHEEFKSVFALETVGELGKEAPTSHNPLEWLNEKFYAYIEDRRRTPRQDVLTELAQAKHEDGSTPEIEDVMNSVDVPVRRRHRDDDEIGQLGDAVHRRQPGIGNGAARRPQQDPGLSRRDAAAGEPGQIAFPDGAHDLDQIGEVEVPAGTTVMLLPGACNRDERKFPDPNSFRSDRPNVREQIAFIRGVHSCPGAPLARAEGRISLNRILDRMSDITISDEHHGPVEARHYAYEPTFIMRGLSELHIEFDPVPNA